MIRWLKRMRLRTWLAFVVFRDPDLRTAVVIAMARRSAKRLRDIVDPPRFAAIEIKKYLDEQSKLH